MSDMQVAPEILRWGPTGPTGWPTGSMTSSPCRKIPHTTCYEQLTDEPPGLAPTTLPPLHAPLILPTH
jgi:hypothetical protein